MDVLEQEKTRLKKRQDLRRLWYLFWSLAKPFFFYSPGSIFNFIWVIFLLLLRSGFVVAFSFLSRDFWTALQHKDIVSFWKLIRLFTLVLICALPTLVWCDYAQQRLSLRWRKWFTEKVIIDYFSHRNYYQIDQQGCIDNPDQRISQDVDAFTNTSLSFFLKVIRAVIDLVNFSFILFSIYPQLFIILLTYSVVGTVIAVLLGRRLINLNFRQLKMEADFRYALIRVRENAESIAFYNGESREKSESTRRFYSAYLNRIDLIIWSRNLSFFTSTYTYIVEILPLALIAPLYFQGSIEMGVVSQASQAFGHILSDLSIIVDEFDRISAFSAGIDRLGDLEQFMYTRFADAQDRNKYTPPRSSSDDDDNGEDIGKIKKSDGRDVRVDNDREDEIAATLYGRQYTLDNFRKLRRRGIILSDSTSHSGSGVRRNNELNEFTLDDDDINTDLGLDNEQTVGLRDEETGHLEAQIETSILPGDGQVIIENLTLATPDIRRRILFENVSFAVTSGQSLLIAGPSGTGKSSLLRAIAGLWVSGHGTIRRPSLSSMFFLPQKPYCTLGTLREQLLYPRSLEQSSGTYTDTDLLNALDDVNLTSLPSRMGGLDSLYDWGNVLSLGEQQRLAFARLIIGRPALAILDECSSALDVPSEQRLYSQLRESGISFISVGHRPSLLNYHDFILRLGGDLGRSFTFERIGDPSTHGM